MPEIIVAGAGTGSLTLEVQEVILRADAVCAAPRFRNLVPAAKKFIELQKFEDTFREIDCESGIVVILVSGDPGLFSLLPLVRRHYGPVRVLPGISSMQVLCARVGESWSDAAILSGHGRKLRAGLFLNVVERNRLTVLFCDSKISPNWACRNLAGIDGVSVVIGECLGTENEHIVSGKPQDFADYQAQELSLLLIRNSSPYVPKNIHPRDSEFLRLPGVVMTNEAVRSVVLGRLNMRSDSVLWDIGAGTGSISVSAGLAFPKSEIHAVEYRSEALSLITDNAKRFHLHNIDLHAGRALEVLGTLPEPSRIFVGGSEGELAGILEHIAGFRARVVVACVTLESLTTAYALMKDWPDFEALQVSVSASKLLTPSATLMKAQSPVTILSASFAL